MFKYIIFVCTLLAPTTSFADDGTGNGNWDGFQLGISGGIGIMSGSDDIGNEQSLSSGIAGVFAGYSHSFNRVVVGLEADVNLSNFTSSTNASRSKAQWNAIGTARIGYDVGGILPYLSIGIGFAGYEITRFADGQEADNTHVGFVAGAGLEAKITDYISARIDYKHLEMSEETYQFDGFSPFRVDGRQDLFSLGVAYNF